MCFCVILHAKFSPIQKDDIIFSYIFFEELTFRLKFFPLTPFKFANILRTFHANICSEKIYQNLHFSMCTKKEIRQEFKKFLN